MIKEYEIDKVIQPMENTMIAKYNVISLNKEMIETLGYEPFDNEEDINEDLQIALDILSFSVNSSKHYKAYKLYQFGLTYDEIASKLGYSNKSGAKKAITMYLQKKEILNDLLKNYIKSQDEISTIKANIIKRGMIDRKSKEIIKIDDGTNK